MSLPTTVIKFRPPPETVLPPESGGGDGGGGGTGGGGGGMLPPPPTENVIAYFLRGDETWAPVLYEHIIGLPLHFPPSLHAPTHAPHGTDPITGLVPPALNDPGQVLLSTGSWGALDYSALTGVPSPGAPSVHGHTHVTTDLVDLATPAHPGLLPKLPVGGSSSSYLGADLGWYAFPAGAQLPAPPGDATQVLLGTGAYGKLAYSSLAGIPALFSPSLHASTHQSNGSDPLPLDTLAAPTDTTYLNTSTLVHGLCPKLSNVVTTYLNGTGKWTNVPLSTTNAPGLLTQLTGTTTDYVGGDNACHPLSGLLPPGSMIDFAGSTAPAGWLLCDGSPYSTTGSYAALFAVIGYTFGGSGGTFNVPDLRGRVSVGAGASPPLANRILGATGGEESHILSATELVSHTHGVAHTHTMGSHTHGVAHTHTMGNHTHLGVDHLHSMQNHTHAGVDHLHGMDHYHNWGAQGSHAHGLGGHTHVGYYHAISGGNTWGGGSGLTYAGANANTGGPSGGSDAAATPAGNTVYASQTSGGWASTGAADRGLTTGGPSSATTGAADRGLTTGGPSTNTTDGASIASTAGPSTNTTDGASIANTGATGGGGGFNVMQPFAVVNKIIKT